MMGLSPRCYMPSFKEIGLPGRRFLKDLTIYGHGGNLGDVTWTIYTNFCSPFLRRFYMKFDLDKLSCFRGGDMKLWTDDDD